MQKETAGITATKKLIVCFRLGVRLMVECMDDGNVTNVRRMKITKRRANGEAICKNILSKTQAELKSKLMLTMSGNTVQKYVLELQVEVTMLYNMCRVHETVEFYVNSKRKS